MTEFKRKDYYKDDDFKVYLEEIDKQIFIHVAIDNFSRPILRRIQEKWGEVAIKVYENGYNELFAYTKDSRIIKMIGGAKKIGQHEKYEVWEWALD